MSNQRVSRKPSRVFSAVHRIFTVLYRWAQSGWAGPAAATWGFLQSAFVPGPSDALLVPLGLAQPKRAPMLAVWTAIGSIIGGLAAYAIGALAFHVIGEPILELFGVTTAEMARFETEFAAKGWLVIVIGSLPLLSSKLIAIVAGAVKFPIETFLLVWSLVRVVRTSIIVGLLCLGGPRVRNWLQRVEPAV
jgi:membrane protein YqaA with SNARE-associated domain